MAIGYTCHTPSCWCKDTAKGTPMAKANSMTSMPSTRRTG